MDGDEDADLCICVEEMNENKYMSGRWISIFLKDGHVKVGGRFAF